MKKKFTRACARARVILINWRRYFLPDNMCEPDQRGLKDVSETPNKPKSQLNLSFIETSEIRHSQF